MGILHDAQKQKFYVVVDGLESYLEYIKTNNVLNLNHTFVPDELRGKGIAAQLVEAVLAYVKANDFKIVPSCWYVAGYIRKHKEYEELVA